MKRLQFTLLFFVPTLCGIAFFQAFLRGVSPDAVPHLTEVMDLISDYVKDFFYVAYIFLIYRAYKYRDALRQQFCVRYILAQLIFALVLVQLLKYGLGWARPTAEVTTSFPAYFKASSEPLPDGYRACLWNTLCLPRLRYRAMPSGHTVDIIISSLPLAILFHRRHWVFVAGSISTALVIFSRLWLRAHYPHDIFGGILIGLLAVYFIQRGRVAKIWD